MISWSKKQDTMRAGAVVLLCLAYMAVLGYVGRAYVADRCFRQGRAMEKQGRWLEALSLYEEAVSLDPDNIWYYEQLGQLYAVRARFPLERQDVVSRAKNTLDKGLALCPGNGALWLSLALIAAETGEEKEASAYFDKAIAFDPHNAFYRAVYSLFYWRQGRESEAFREAGEALSCASASEVFAFLKKMGADEGWIQRLGENLNMKRLPASGRSS